MSTEYLFTTEQWSIINGSLLGDGHITNQRYGNSAFAKNQCGKHEDYLKWHFDKLTPYSCSIKYYDNYCLGKKYDRISFRTKSNLSFAKLREKWYPSGKKIIPQDLKLDPLTIAVWFFDDGSNSIKSRCCKFATYCFTKKECEFLAEELTNFNIKCNISKKNVIIVKTQSYKELVDLIKPYMLWDCFKHKVQYRDSELSFTTEEEALKIFELFKSGDTQRQIAKKVGRSTTLVSTILRGCRKHYLGLSVAKEGVSLNNTTGFTGVCWEKNRNKWRVDGKKNNKNVYLGRFKKKEDAIKARKNWEIRNK
jgi:hypothetical protein